MLDQGHNWTWTPVEALITSIKAGASPVCSDRQPEEGEPGVLKTSAVTGDVFAPAEAKAFDGEAPARLKTPVRAGSILMCRKNTPELVGASVLARVDAPNLYLSDLLWEVRTKKGVDPVWLHAALNLPRVKARLQSSATGSSKSMRNLSMDRLRELEVPLPPLPEQRRIAGILRTWDEAIDAASRLTDAKRRRLDVLRANLMTPAHRGEGWRMAPLGELTAEGKGRNKGGALGREQVMGVSNARGVVPMRDATIASDLTRYKLLPPQGFAYNPMRINVGSIAMSVLDAPVLVSPDYVVFTCRPKALAPGYLDHFRRTRFWNHYVNAMGSGSVRVRIYYRDLADIEIPVPGLAEQKRILGVLDLAAQDLAASKAHLEALKRQKRGLMQKLLTGEWRVPA